MILRVFRVILRVSQDVQSEFEGRGTGTGCGNVLRVILKEEGTV